MELAIAFAKKCRRCGEIKNSDQLKRDSRNKDGFSSFCKQCHGIATREWQASNKERLAKYRKNLYAKHREKHRLNKKERYDSDSAHLKNIFSRYKVTEDWYKSKLKEQNYSCSICNKKTTELKKRLSVDHDHLCCPSTPTCGNCNRGLLCNSCNISLHDFEISKNWVLSAVSYLEKHKVKNGN